MSFLSVVASILEQALQELGFKQIDFSDELVLDSSGSYLAYRKVYCRLRDTFVALEAPLALLQTLDLSTLGFDDVLMDFCDDLGLTDLGISYDAGNVEGSLMLVAGIVYYVVTIPVVYTPVEESPA